MAIILTKKSDTASSVPLAADLTNAAGGAELAVNTADKRLYSKTSGGAVVELGTNPSVLTLPNGTANAVPYLNGSKVLTSGSALTFDGTTLNVGIGGVGKIQVGTASSATYQTGFYGSNGVDTDFQIRFKTGVTEFGTGTSTPLAFSYGGSEQMRLTSTGLGIGTSSPARKLDVNGSIQIPSNNALYINGSSNYLYADTSAMELASATQLKLVTNGALRATLDTSGNLGLGVTPSAWASGYKAINIGSFSAIADDSVNDGALSLLSNAYGDTSTSWKYRSALSSGAGLYKIVGNTHKWFTAPSGTEGNAISFTQAMTLDASGVLNVGATSFGFAKRAGFRGDSTTVPTVEIQNESATGTMLTFRTNGESQVGSVSFTSTGVLYNVTSDARAKHDIIDAPEASGLIDAIKVRSFKWNANDSEQRYGFIAQELVTVAPEAVHQPADPEEMMAVDYSKLVPMLVKEIQSLRKRLAAAGI